MTGDNRKRVALKVIEQLKQGKKKNVAQAMRDVGYAKSSCDCKTTEVANSKEYKETTKEFIEQLENQVQNSIKDMLKKQVKSSFRDNLESVEKLARLKKELLGVATEEKLTIKWED